MYRLFGGAPFIIPAKTYNHNLARVVQAAWDGAVAGPRWMVGYGDD